MTLASVGIIHLYSNKFRFFMDCLFQTALIFRSNLVALLNDADDDILDTVPEAFNNTIRWQVAHLIASPYLLTYKKVKMEHAFISDTFAESVKKGTNQEDFALSEDYDKKHLLEYLTESTKQMQRDYANLKKGSYEAYESSSGLVLKDIDTAISYSNIHDGLHIAQIKIMMKILG